MTLFAFQSTAWRETLGSEYVVDGFGVDVVEFILSFISSSSNMWNVVADFVGLGFNPSLY